MRKIAVSVTALLAVFAVACVTINVYFPEAAAVEAADRIIDKVRGEGADDTSSFLCCRDGNETPMLLALSGAVGRFLMSDANAQAPVDFCPYIRLC